MKRTCILLLALSLLMPCFALAEGPRVDPPVDVEFSSAAPINGAEVAWRILENAYATNDMEKRIGLIMKAAKSAPGNVDILLNCATSLLGSDLQRRYTAETEAMLREAMLLGTGNQWLAAVQLLAEVLTIDGRAEEAVKLAEDAIQEAPNNEALKILLASTLYYDSRNDEALVILEALAEDSPHNLDALRLRAAILSDECRWSDAITAYNQIDSQWPEYLDGKYGLYLVYAASGQFDRASRAIDELLRSGAEQGLWLERARLRLWKQYRPEEALAEAEALLRVDPEWADALTVKLGAHLMTEDYAQADKTVETISALDQNYGLLLQGITSMEKGEWAEAEKAFEELTAAVPTAFVGWQHRGAIALEGHDDPEKALHYLGKAFESTLAWFEYDPFLLLGRTYRRMGDQLEAARAFAEADRLTNESPTPLYYLIITCADAGRAEDMVDILEEMERRYPGWYETMLARVIVGDVLGNADAALNAYMAFKDKFPFPAEGLRGMEATLLASAGDAQGAMIAKEEIDAMENAGALEWETYAFALFLIGDYDAAAEALDTAEALLKNEDAQTARARDARVNIETTRADIQLARGDIEGCTAALTRAAEDGFPLSTLVCFPRFSEYCASEAYQALLETQAAQISDWDLSVAPKVPMAAKDAEPANILETPAPEDDKKPA